MDDTYKLSMDQACKFLNRSERSISRYIGLGLLHPLNIGSQQNTPEYRFSESDLTAFLDREKNRHARQDTPGQTRQAIADGVPVSSGISPEQNIISDTPGQTRQDTPKGTYSDDFVELLIEDRKFLREEINIKNQQISNLTQLGGAIHNKQLLTSKKEETDPPEQTEEPDQTSL